MFENPTNAEQQIANAVERIALEMTVLRNTLETKAEGQHTHTPDQITGIGDYAKKTDLTAYAPLNSPNFEGSPSAPTPSSSDNSTRLATTAFVQALIADFDSSGAFARLTGANFTGTVTFPTAGQTSNDTTGATTAWVTLKLTTSLRNYVSNSSLSSTLSNYVTSSALTNKLGSYVTTSGLNSKLQDYVTSTSLTSTLGSYALKSSLSSYAPLSGATFTGAVNFNAAVNLRGTTTCATPTTASNVANKSYVDAQVKTVADQIDQITGGIGDFVTETELTSRLQSYVTRSNLTSTLASYVTTSSLNSTLASYAKTSALAAYAKLAGATFTGAVNFNAAANFKGATTCNTPTASNHVANKSYVDSKIDSLSSIPTGTIIHFGGKTVPDGFLLCNGAAVSRTEYANLFAVIGTNFGSGNGSTTFNVPDLNARFVEGTTNTSSVGTRVSAGLPNITGKFIVGKITSGNGYQSEYDGIGAFTRTANTANTAEGWENSGIRYSFDANRSSGLYGDSSTVQPAALRVLVCIKS